MAISYGFYPFLSFPASSHLRYRTCQEHDLVKTFQDAVRRFFGVVFFLFSPSAWNFQSACAHWWAVYPGRRYSMALLWPNQLIHTSMLRRREDIMVHDSSILGSLVIYWFTTAESWIWFSGDVSYNVPFLHLLALCRLIWPKPRKWLGPQCILATMRWHRDWWPARPKVVMRLGSFGSSERCSAHSHFRELLWYVMIFNTHTHSHTHGHTHTYIYTHIYRYVYVYIHTYIHTYIPTYLHTYIHTYIHTYMHICIYIYIHIHIYIYALIYFYNMATWFTW